MSTKNYYFIPSPVMMALNIVIGEDRKYTGNPELNDP